MILGKAGKIVGIDQVYVVDVSRWISRIHINHHTGIDRVLDAYIRFALNHPHSIFIARAYRCNFIFSKDKFAKFYDLVESQRSEIGASENTRSLCVQFSEKVTRVLNFRYLLKFKNKVKYVYFNVGHSNLKTSLLRSFSKQKNLWVVTMIHDVIPLDYPQYCRADMIRVFQKRFSAAMRYSNLVIFNSEYTKRRALENYKKPVNSMVSHLAIENNELKQSKSSSAAPYFVMLGTIEPRKNHQLLLNVWSSLEPKTKDCPKLYIIGRRGWNNEAVFQRLDSKTYKNVIEIGDADDAAVSDLLSGARALLFPSFEEGFGLPILEAARYGIPVLCSDKPVFHEIAYKGCSYIDENAVDQWREKILNLSKNSQIHFKDDNFFSSKYFGWDRHFLEISQNIKKLVTKKIEE